MDIESFVPPRVLAPLEYNAQGVHLICDLADGKTRPYAYVECISVEAAEQLIREADAQYLAGRQVAFRPVTQKEPALDLFPSLRKGGYHRDVIVRSSPSKAGLSRGYAHTHGSDEAGMELELFTEEHYQQFKVLFDMALGPPARDSQTAINEPHLQQEHANSSLFYSFPPERPFARLVSMIVKYPCHAKKNTSNHSTQEYNQEIDCLLRCSLCEIYRSNYRNSELTDCDMLFPQTLWTSWLHMSKVDLN